MSDTSKKEFKRSFSGYVEICEKMPTGMITVRGDLNSRKLKSAFIKVVGATLPKERKVTLAENSICLLYTSPSPRDMRRSRMPSSA